MQRDDLEMLWMWRHSSNRREFQNLTRLLAIPNYVHLAFCISYHAGHKLMKLIQRLVYCSPHGPDAFEILSTILEMIHVDGKTQMISTGHVHALHLFKNKFFAYTVGSHFATVLLRWFTFMTLVESDQALPTCGAPLSQLSVLSLLSVLPALFWCACVSSFTILVQFF